MIALRPQVMLVVLAAAVFAAACTPTGIEPSTSVSGDPSSTSVTPQVSSTTMPPSSTTTTLTSIGADGTLLPPERDETSATAADALSEVPGFSEEESPSRTAQDLEVTMQRWLIPDFTHATTSAFYVRSETDTLVSVLSVIPSMNFRGDPGFVEALITFASGSEPLNLEGDDVFRATDPSGANIYFWSTGDGFLMASAIDDADAQQYLHQRSREATPNDAWTTGSCLFLSDDELLPYAPFPVETVVPCEGAHNAEVLLGQTIGTDLVAFDADSIAYDRNYECDREYESVFGSQRTHTPTLISYMPDEAEWARGDRYLACVVLINLAGGRELVAGPMSDKTDLDWMPEPGECLANGIPSQATSCEALHEYEYLGDAEVIADVWPGEGSVAFQEACADLLDGLAPGPTQVEALLFGLGAYAFEQGERTVRCVAFATADALLVEVKGSFTGEWTVVGESGVAA